MIEITFTWHVIKDASVAIHYVSYIAIAEIKEQQEKLEI